MKRKFCWAISVIAGGILFSQLLQAEDEKATVGIGMGLKTSEKVSFDSTLDNSFKIIAEPGNEWKFVEEYTQSNWGLGEDNDSRKASSSITCDPKETTQLFAGVLSGKMSKPGPEPGELVPWDVTGNAEFLVIVPTTPVILMDRMNDPPKVLYSKEKGNNNSIGASVESDWTINNSGGEKITGKPQVSIGRAVDNADWCPEPGVYTITAEKPNNSEAKDSVEIKLIEIEIEGPVATADGLRSADFTANVLPTTLEADATTYEWKWEAPENVGNNPQIEYTDGDEKTTKVNKAHWFANPNSPLMMNTGWDCHYTIICEVTIEGKKCKGTVSWKVYIPLLSCGAPAAVSNPQITGIPEIQSEERNGVMTWYVAGIGTLTRKAPERIAATGFTAASQFWNKIYVVHEGRHLEQWATWPDLIMLYDANGLYNNNLITMTSTVSGADLEAAINQRIVDENDSSFLIMDNLRDDMEDDACAESTAVTPHYLE